MPVMACFLLFFYGNCMERCAVGCGVFWQKCCSVRAELVTWCLGTMGESEDYNLMCCDMKEAATYAIVVALAFV